MAHKKPQTLLREMQRGFDRFVARDICDYCFRNKCDPFVTFINAQQLGQDVLKSWDTDEAKTFIADQLKAQQAQTDIWDSDDEMAQRDAALQLMDKYFISTNENGGTLYKIADGTNMIVEVCCANNIEIQVGQHIKHELAAHQKAAKKSLVTTILDFYQHNCMVWPAPKLWAQQDEPMWCLARAMIEPDPRVKYLHIQALLDRLNDPEAFAAYLWGIYSGLNRGRQCLYVSEEIGESGKSSFLRHFQKLFGDVITAALNWNVLSNSTHASAHFAGKKLVVIGDNKNPNILMSQAIKELSGDDKVMIDQKYEAVYSTYLQCRLVILSNMPCNITSERHNQSRTLWITLAPLSVPVDPTWSDHYDAEMPGFLAYAEQCYLKRCPDNYEIKVNDAVKAAVQLRVAEFEAQFIHMFDTNFVIDKAGVLTNREFNETMDASKWNSHERHNFLLWLSRMYFNDHPDGLPRKHTNKGLAYLGIRAKTSRDRRGAETMDMGDEAPFSAGGHRYDA